LINFTLKLIFYQKLRELYEDDLKIHKKTKELLKQAIDQVKAREEALPVAPVVASNSSTESKTIEMQKYIEMEEELNHNLQEKVNELNNLKDLLTRMKEETKSKIDYYLNQSQSLRDQLEEKSTKFEFTYSLNK
jgi:hypothetical protein